MQCDSVFDKINQQLSTLSDSQLRVNSVLWKQLTPFKMGESLAKKVNEYNKAFGKLLEKAKGLPEEQKKLYSIKISQIHKDVPKEYYNQLNDNPDSCLEKLAEVLNKMEAAYNEVNPSQHHTPPPTDGICCILS